LRSLLVILRCSVLSPKQETLISWESLWCLCLRHCLNWEANLRISAWRSLIWIACLEVNLRSEAHYSSRKVEWSNLKRGESGSELFVVYWGEHIVGNLMGEQVMFSRG
jgi:hypothetical protein